jgi:hypothetical protein
MAKYLAMTTKKKEVESSLKAQVHIIVVPVFISYLINMKYMIVLPMFYIVMIILYFNVKVLIYPDWQYILDKRSINELSLILITIVLGIITLILLIVW